MKTIFDAVNELKGDLGNTTGGHNKLTEFILAFRCIDSKYFAFNNSRGLSECFQYICTVEQFNALVDAMKLGLDINAITNDMFHAYTYSAKELLEPVERCFEIDSDRLTNAFKKNNAMNDKYVVDWGNAPDWATEYGFIGGIIPSRAFANSTSYQHISPKKQQNIFTFGVNGYERAKFKLVSTRPTKQASNTYTQEEQAIKDACDIVDDSKRCNDTNINIDCSAAQKAVIITLIKNGYIKPPVPLIDGEAYQFEHQSGDTVVGIYSESQQSFDNYGIKYYPWHCTNIKPLTLAK